MSESELAGPMFSKGSPKGQHLGYLDGAGRSGKK